MGFFSALGKIGAGIAAPFTGGASLALIPAIDAASSILGKQQQGAAQGKITQAQLNQGQDRNAIDLYNSQQGAQFRAGDQDLDRKKWESENRGTTAKQALIASLLGGVGGPMTATSIKDGKSSGGILAGLQNNPDAIAALRNLHGQADKAQMAVPNFAGGNILNAPSLTPLQQVDKGGFLSKLANIGQIVGGVGSAVGGGSADVPSIYAQQGLGASVPGQSVAGLSIPGQKNPYVVEEDDWSNR